MSAVTDSQTQSAAAAQSAPSLPPVLVMNLFYSGLGIARDLMGTGVRVVGLSGKGAGYGNHTRSCEVRLTPNSQTHPEELVSYLLSVAEEFRGAVIFPTRDADVVLLDSHRALLGQHYRLAIPPADCLQCVLQKHSLAKLASRVGVSVPRTMIVQGQEDLQSVAQLVGFPCVVKPVSSIDWRRGHNWKAVGSRKAFRVDGVAHLEREYAELASVCSSVLVQEWIPGGTEDIVVLAGYVNADSDPVAFFTARKCVQFPEDFGTGCVVASEPIPALHEPTRRLWKALRYHGMAEVEYKRDAATGEYKLIEINTRHWDQHRLARASGINLTWIAYCDLIGNTPSVQNVPTARATWIAEDGFSYYALRSVYRREGRLLQLLGSLRGPRVYGISSFSDPFPGLCQAGLMARQALSGLIAKLRHRSLDT
jgi:D-aspartate ligase